MSVQIVTLLDYIVVGLMILILVEVVVANFLAFGRGLSGLAVEAEDGQPCFVVAAVGNLGIDRASDAVLWAEEGDEPHAGGVL